MEAEAGARTLTLPWTPPSPYRKREIIQGATDANASARPMRANARAILIDALRDAHRWLDELLSDPLQTLESLASREGKTDRSIRMTLSLAFLAPDIVKAAVEGRLPRGFGLKRLVDLPMAWPDQWRALGLEAPARIRRPAVWHCVPHSPRCRDRIERLRQQLWKRKFAARDFGRDRAEKGRSTAPDPTAETALRRIGYGNVGLFLDPGKSRQFAPTSWWS